MKFKTKYLLLIDNKKTDNFEEKDLKEELNYLKKKNINKFNIVSKIIENNKITLSDINILNMNGIHENFLIYKLIRSWCYIWWIFLILVLMIIIDSGVPKSSIFTIIIILSISLVPYFLYNKVKSNAIKIIKKYKKSKSNENSRIKIIEDKISAISKEIQARDLEIKKNMVKNYEKFTLFRKKHYNNNFEKFLFDLDIDEEYEKNNIKYIRVNSNNKISNGEIEDYVTFIQEKLNEIQ